MNSFKPSARLSRFQPVVSTSSLTRFLAYIHHYTPVVLPGRWLSPRHLRRLAGWIGYPHPTLRSVRLHPALTAHLALLCGTGLLSKGDQTWNVAPWVMTWLHRSPGEQLRTCLDVLDNDDAWEHVIVDLRLQETIGCDYRAYVQQTIHRQVTNPPEAGQGSAYWLASESPDETKWRLCLPPDLSSWLLFDLLQLGEWEPGEPLVCTPLSLTAAAHRGYSAQHIWWLLETATQEALPATKEQQLNLWLRQNQTYQVRQVTLLSTKQPQQLDEILARKRWRSYFGEQLSPRHTIIQTDIIPQLEKWLAEKGFALNDNVTDSAPSNGTGLRIQNGSSESPQKETLYNWLGLRVLVGLGDLIRLPYTPPHGLLDGAARQLTATQRSELEDVVQAVLENLRTAIQGWDAFWPAEKDVSLAWLNQIEEAIEKECPLDIVYQSLGGHQPAYRRIQPLRLEQRGSLYYLHAYCYRVEANLVFRVDRIHEILDK